MRKGIFGKAAGAALGVLAGVLVFTACEHSVSGGSRQSGTGTIKVSIGVVEQIETARTVHPEVSGFTRYALSFEATEGGAAHDPVVVTGGSAEIELVLGTYTITAKAYTGTDPNFTAVAKGVKAGVAVTEGDNSPVQIFMSPDTDEGGEGTFSYSITVPGGASGTLTITKNNEVVGSPVNLTAGTANGTVSLAAGTYRVSVRLSKPVDSEAGVVEALHIYKGMTSSFTKTYTDNDFAPPRIVTASDLTSFFPAPVTEAAPVHSLTGTEYSGTVVWKTGDTGFTGTAFGASTAYTAVVTLTANPGYTFTGVGADFFTHTNATSHTNDAGSGVVTLGFPATAAAPVPGQASGSLRVTIGFDYGDITVSSTDATIYKTGTPNSLNLSVEGYDRIAWYIDGDTTTTLSGNPVTIEAKDYAVQTHTASFTGTRNEIEYSTSVSFTVAETRTEEKAATPTTNSAAGEVASGTQVTLSTTTTGATIYYTTNGDTPDNTKTQYTAAITINAAVTIKAIAVKAGMTNSDILEVSYTVSSTPPPKKAATPTADPVAGEVASGTQVMLNTTTTDAAIYYTLNGDTPDNTKTQYTAAITINAAVTIKAIAVKAGMTNSDILTAAYTVSGEPESEEVDSNKPSGFTTNTLTGVAPIPGDIAYGNGTYIAATGSTATNRGLRVGSALSGLTIKSNIVTSAKALAGVAYGGSGGTHVFVAVGKQSTIIRSTDQGANWTEVKTDSSGSTLYAVAYGPNTFVAVGAGGTILKSSDLGTTWTEATWTGTALTTDLTYIIHDGSRFIALGNDSLAVSVDGASWSGAEVTGIRVAVASNNAGTYVAAYNTESTVWKLKYCQLPAGTTTNAGIASHIGTSDNWKEVGGDLPSSSPFKGLVWSGKRFMALTNGGLAYFSAGGTSWNSENGWSSVGGSTILGLGFVNSEFVVFGGGQSPKIYSLADWN
jgi:hypothetical protein